jgi:hypothetical protein
VVSQEITLLHQEIDVLPGDATMAEDSGGWPESEERGDLLLE